MSELKEEDYRKSIINLFNSKEFQELKSYYSRKSIFSILGIMRNENIHSNFLAWLLNSGESHGLGDYPIKKFMELLVMGENDASYTKKLHFLFPDDLVDSIISGNYDVLATELVREKVVPSGRIDIFIDVELIVNGVKDNIKIILENKVYSKEHSDQTQCYYDWAKSQFKDLNRLVFVFLTPLPSQELISLKEQQCCCKEYIQINYQYLVNYLLEPCRKQEMSQESASIIESYLRCLSYPSIDVGADGTYSTDGGLVMAVSERERKLLLDFWESNKPLLLAMLNVLKDDEDTDESDRTIIQKTINVISTKSSKDYTQYYFNGAKYAKSRLVFSVVKEYVETRQVTFDKLKECFRDDLQGSIGVICKWPDIKNNNYYYSKPSDILKSADGTEFSVCNQWNKNNIVQFIDKARELGFDIKEAPAN